jgi:hypothetical protein
MAFASRMRDISKKFEALHGIPYVVGAIDRNHIPIVAPSEHITEYYNRKGFLLVLPQ